jgi:hypothetical protein
MFDWTTNVLVIAQFPEPSQALTVSQQVALGGRVEAGFVDDFLKNYRTLTELQAEWLTPSMPENGGSDEH